MDEAETGLKSALAVKVFGADLDTLQKKGKAIKQILEQVRGIREVTLVQELGQPSLTIKINRARIARYGLNVSDIDSLIETASAADVATQVVQEEKQFDLVVRLEQNSATTRRKSATSWWRPPAGQQIPLGNSRTSRSTNGASFIYREDNSRYIGIQYSVQGRDLAGAVGRPAQVDAQVKCPGLPHSMGRRIQDYTASRSQLSIMLPLTWCSSSLLFALYSNFKFPWITVVGVVLSGPVGGLVALC